MNDDVAKYNKARWEELAKYGVEHSKPFLDLDESSAHQFVVPYNIMGNVQGKSVLCLAGGGGQQSVAFGLLGASVSVLDISETQLAQDRQALEHYGLQAQLEQGDMRNLSVFEDNSFDVVWNAYSINFVPDVAPVFDEVCRVIRPDGLYCLGWGNPFLVAMEESDWTEKGYPIKRIYADAEIIFDDDDQYWDVTDADGNVHYVPNPREFNHTLSTVTSGLIQRQFQLLGIWESDIGDPVAEPGSWEHLKAVAPRGLTVWARYVE